MGWSYYFLSPACCRRYPCSAQRCRRDSSLDRPIDGPCVRSGLSPGRSARTPAPSVRGHSRFPILPRGTAASQPSTPGTGKSPPRLEGCCARSRCLSTCCWRTLQRDSGSYTRRPTAWAERRQSRLLVRCSCRRGRHLRAGGRSSRGLTAQRALPMCAPHRGHHDRNAIPTI